MMIYKIVYVLLALFVGILLLLFIVYIGNSIRLRLYCIKSRERRE